MKISHADMGNAGLDPATAAMVSEDIAPMRVAYVAMRIRTFTVAEGRAALEKCIHKAPAKAGASGYRAHASLVHKVGEVPAVYVADYSAPNVDWYKLALAWADNRRPNAVSTTVLQRLAEWAGAKVTLHENVYVRPVLRRGARRRSDELRVCRKCGGVQDPSHDSLTLDDNGVVGGQGACGDHHTW